MAKKKEVYHVKPLTEGKKNIIALLDKLSSYVIIILDIWKHSIFIDVKGENQ